MRETYWMLSIYGFLVIAGTVFVIFPTVMLIAGILLGLASFYFGFNSAFADILIISGSFSWKHWKFFLPTSIVLTAAFILFTDFARKTKTYRRIKIKNESK